MIIKRRHTANFTTIGNRLFEDERLAADEVGVLAYLLSRPHDWEVRRPALSRRWGMGRDAIKRVVSNLVRFGWCVARKDRLPNGTFYMIYEIRDEPGPTLTDEEVRRALSLVSSEAVSDESDVITVLGDVPLTVDPPTGYPSLADPPPADPPLAYIDIQNKDLPRKDSTQKPEREGARAREKHILNLAAFKHRWPDVANDDQTRLDRAWFGLSNEEGEAALAGMVGFFEGLKRSKKTHIPASWRYLEEKRWTLLEQAKPESAGPVSHAPGSPEARAVKVLHDIARRTEAFFKIWRRSDGSVNFNKPMTPQLTAISQAPEPSEWVELSRQQAAAWEGLLRSFFDDGVVRQHMREGARAPWAWPPRKDGTLSAGPPTGELSNEDLDALANEGQR